MMFYTEETTRTGIHDPHRPVTQWNGQHIDGAYNHVMRDETDRWYIETPAEVFLPMLIEEQRKNPIH